METGKDLNMTLLILDTRNIALLYPWSCLHHSPSLSFRLSFFSPHYTLRPWNSPFSPKHSDLPSLVWTFCAWRVSTHFAFAVHCLFVSFFCCCCFLMYTHLIFQSDCVLIDGRVRSSRWLVKMGLAVTCTVPRGLKHSCSCLVLAEGRWYKDHGAHLEESRLWQLLVVLISVSLSWVYCVF